MDDDLIYIERIRLREISMGKNNVKSLREAQLMSKAELARKAGVSPLTIDRIERGENCRMDTKRKIILALGFNLTERQRVFFEDEDGENGSRKSKTGIKRGRDGKGRV